MTEGLANTSRLESEEPRNGDELDADRLLTGDVGLTVLLAVQALVTFVIVPLATSWADMRWVLDLARLLFAGVCVVALTSRRSVQAALLAGLVTLVAVPRLWDHLGSPIGLGGRLHHDLIATTAFGFNALVTVLVARGAFGPGRVTNHRVLGAVLVYLNVAILFAIAYDLLEANLPGAIRDASGRVFAHPVGVYLADLSYFSLSTITSTGYGDLVPVHPLARSLANLEAMFGQLFPAILVSRLVTLHIAHRGWR
jgi:hypothetical protein